MMICGINIDKSNREEFSLDMKYIISGLYEDARKNEYSVKVIEREIQMCYDGNMEQSYYRVV